MNTRPIGPLIALWAAFVVAPAGASAPNPLQGSTMDGAHPPGVLGDEQRGALRRILAPYRPDTLTAAQVREIRAAIAQAGLRPGPALDAALAAEGFSRKRMEELLPPPPVPADATASPPARTPPRRQ